MGPTTRGHSGAVTAAAQPPAASTGTASLQGSWEPCLGTGSSFPSASTATAERPPPARTAHQSCSAQHRPLQAPLAWAGTALPVLASHVAWPDCREQLWQQGDGQWLGTQPHPAGMLLRAPSQCPAPGDCPGAAAQPGCCTVPEMEPEQCFAHGLCPYRLWARLELFFTGIPRWNCGSRWKQGFCGLVISGSERFQPASSC